MKLFTRKNALLLTAVIILLAAACAFALSREQKELTPLVTCYRAYARAARTAEDAAVIRRINETKPDFVWVGLGAPKQELWIARNGPATGAHLLCGLGGSLDIFAGTVERAPKFWSDHGLEWFYRLCKEPKRIGRMMKLPLFLVHVRQEKGKRK